MKIYTTLKTVPILTLLCWAGLVRGQDIHFSHIHASPTLLNPAMNGLFNGDLRFIANYRSQWETFTNGFRTMMGSADMKVARVGVYDFIGAGLQVFSDKAGDLDFTTTSVGLSVSMIKSLDHRDDHFIAFGIQNNFVTNRVDYTNVVAFQSLQNLDGSVGDESSFWDLNAGLSWFYAFDRYSFVYFGASYFHINDPNVSLLRDNRSGLNQVPRLFRKLVFHGGADFDINWAFKLKPSFIFVDQGPHQEVTVGSFLKFNYERLARSKAKNAVYFGLWFRWYLESDVRGIDAFVTALRFDLKRTFITFSFDTNVSKLFAASSGAGGPELSVIHSIDLHRSKRRNSKIKCPSF
ncbi:MAG: PorP/SprF family type IX secretion system membrane protein [Bacteroidota bacterium]